MSADMRKSSCAGFFEDLVTRKIQSELSGSYQWLDGECWYRGEPIAGRMTVFERRVIDRAISEARSEVFS